MKKIYSLVAAFAVIAAMVSCNKEESQAPASKIEIAIDVENSDATKAIQTQWEKGNVIYVFFNGNYNEQTKNDKTYLRMEYDGTQWNSSCPAEGYLESLPSFGKMTAIFASADGEMGFSASNGYLYIQNEKITSYYKKKSALKTRDFLAAPETDYAIVGNKIKGKLSFTRGDNLIDLQIQITSVNPYDEFYFMSTPVTSINYFYINSNNGEFGRAINGRGNTNYYQGGVIRDGNFVVYAKKPVEKDADGNPFVTPITLDQEITFTLVNYTLKQDYEYTFKATQQLVDAWNQPNTVISVSIGKFKPVE